MRVHVMKEGCTSAKCGVVSDPHHLVRAHADKMPLAPHEQLCRLCTTPDVVVVNHGTLVQFHLKTAAAKEWVKIFVEVEPYMWLGDDSFCCEHRCAADIASGMASEGLEVV